MDSSKNLFSRRNILDFVYSLLIKHLSTIEEELWRKKMSSEIQGMHIGFPQGGLIVQSEEHHIALCNAIIYKLAF